MPLRGSEIHALNLSLPNLVLSLRQGSGAGSYGGLPPSLFLRTSLYMIEQTWLSLSEESGFSLRVSVEPLARRFPKRALGLWWPCRTLLVGHWGLGVHPDCCEFDFCWRRTLPSSRGSLGSVTSGAKDAFYRHDWRRVDPRPVGRRASTAAARVLGIRISPLGTSVGGRGTAPTVVIHWRYTINEPFCWFWTPGYGGCGFGIYWSSIGAGSNALLSSFPPPICSLFVLSCSLLLDFVKLLLVI